MASKEEKRNYQMRWYDNYSSTLWYEILFGKEMLALEIDFLKHKREGGKSYKDYVSERLLCAAKAMISLPGEMIAIPQLLHTASSVILTESKRNRVDATLDLFRSKEPFREIDPAVVITSAALFFLIRNTEEMFAEQEEDMELIKHIHTRLDQMNWLLGTLGMKELDILRLDECYPNLTK